MTFVSSPEAHLNAYTSIRGSHYLAPDDRGHDFTT